MFSHHTLNFKFPFVKFVTKSRDQITLSVHRDSSPKLLPPEIRKTNKKLHVNVWKYIARNISSHWSVYTTVQP